MSMTKEEKFESILVYINCSKIKEQYYIFLIKEKQHYLINFDLKSIIKQNSAELVDWDSCISKILNSA